MNDWVTNTRIDRRYSLSCLESALNHAPEDVLAYSDFEEQVGLARQRLLRKPQAAGHLTAGAEPSGDDARAIPLPLIVLSAFAAVLLLAGGADFGWRKLAELRARRSRR